MIFAVASQNRPISHEIEDPWLPGVMLLLIAGICWLYSSSLQSQIVRLRPEIDASDHFLLTGVLILPGLLLMSLLLFSSDSTFGLFAIEHFL